MKLNDFLNLNRQVNGQAAGGTSGLPTIPAPDSSMKVRIPQEMRDVINQQKAEMRAGIFADPAANPAYGGTVAKGYSDLKRAFSEVAENPFSAVADDALAQMRTAAGQTVRDQQGVMDYNTLGNAQAAEDWRRANNVAAGDTPPWQQNDPVWRPDQMEAEEDARQEQYASAQLRRDQAQSILDAVNAEMRSRRRNTLAQMPLTDLEAEYARAQQTGGGRGGAERLTDLREAVVEKRPDFAELSKKVNTKVMNDIYMGANGIFRGNPSATAITANQMDGRERAVYNYLYNTAGLEEANRYYEELKPTLQVRADQRGREFTQEMAKDPVMATILNVADVLASPARGVSALAGVATSAVTGQPIDIYSPQFGLVRANRNINEATSEAIGGGVGSFLYSTAKSIAENLYMVALTQGAGSIAAGAAEGQALATIGRAAENAQLAIMGTNAASAAILDAKEKGWSDEQAVVGGFLAGVAEVAFEKISLDRLLSNQAAKGVKAGIVNALKQGGVEASEEVFTELANALTNSLVGGDKSDFALAVKEAIANGANEEQARQAAVLQIAQNVALAGLGGFVSGGVMGGGKSILDSAGQTGGITQRQTASVQTETTPQQAGQSAVAEAESTTEPAARRAAVDAAVLAQLQADRNLPRGTGAASSGFSATEGNTGNVAVDRVAVGDGEVRPIDNAGVAEYNNAQGGAVNGESVYSVETGSQPDGSGSLQSFGGRSVQPIENQVGGLSGRVGEPSEGRGYSEQNSQLSGIVRISPELENSYKERGIVPVELQDITADSAAFSAALTEARDSQPENGWAVTPKSVEDLQGLRTYITTDGAAGFGVSQDGDIEAVFKRQGGKGGVSDTLIPVALENGGKKLDCYGEGLVKLYNRYGFIPVARVEFNEQYANPGWNSSKGTPYIYFMVHNGDSPAQVVQNKGKYHVWTKEELDSLPTYGKEGYDEAYAYRDGLLQNQQQTSGANAPAMGQKASEQAVANAQQAATAEEAIQTIAGEIGAEQTVLNAMRSTPTRTNLPLAENLTLETADGSEAVTGEQYLDAYRHATEADARAMDMLALEQRLNETDAAVAAAIASRDDAAISRAILEREAWHEHADLMRYRQYVESGEGDVSRFIQNVLQMEDIRDNPIMVEALAGDYGRHVVQHHWMTEQLADQILSDEKTTREALQAVITGKGPTAEQALAVWDLAQEDIRNGRFGDALDKTIAINRAMTRSGRFSDSARLMYADRSPEAVLLNMMSMMEGQTTTEEGRESLDRLTKAVKKADDEVIRQSADQLAKAIDGDVQAAEEQQRTAQRETVRDMQNAIRRQDNSSEALARKIRNTAEKFKKDAALTKDEQLTRRMVNDLYEIARSTAENDEDLRKLNELSPWDFAREALTNRDQYRKVWEGARDLIRTKYANDADMQAVIEQWGRRWLDDEAFYGTDDFFDQVLAPLIRRSMREQGFTWRSFYDGAANVSQDAFAADFANRLGLEPGTEIYDQVTEWLNRRISQKVDVSYANLRQSLNEGQPEQEQWEAVLRQALIENGTTMREVVADYYNVEQRDNLVQHILNRLGLTGEQAETVRAELNRQLYEANEAARQQRLERLLRTNSTDVGRLRREGVGLSIRKGTSRSAERLIEILVNGGAEQDYRSALSQVYGIPTLNEDQAVRILNLARQLEGLDPRTREYNEIYNQIVDVMSENVAMRPGEAFTALIKTGMLSNIKTHVTNVGSTGASAQVRRANNAISAGLERILRVAPEDRRHSAFASAGKAGKARENVAKEAWDNYVGYMYRRTGGYIDPNTSVGKRYDRIFKGTNPTTRTINALSGFLSNTLEREDEMWAKQVFVDAAASAMKAQGVTEMTDEIAEYAMQEALFYTFHRSTKLSKVMKTIKESGPVGRVIDVGVLPFTGTPSDLITQALVDYNPVVQAAAIIINRVRNGYDASDIVERVGKGLTGTALYALGMALFQAGVLHLTDGSDKEKKLSQAQNLDDYSLRIGNLNINISNVQPYLIPLTQGAVLAQLVNDLASEDKDVDALKHLLDSMATSVIDTSYFSSLANALQTNPGEDSGGFVGRLAANTAQNLGSMYVPSIVSAIGRSIDNTQRQSYIWGGDNELSRVGLSGVKRLPGVSYNMAEKIDMWGNPLTRSGTGNEGVDALNAVNNLLNPLAVTANQYADDPITQEVSRLFEEGYSAAVPNVPSRKQAGDGYMPTDQEYAEYLRTLGQLRREFAENMVQSDAYRNAGDEDKAKMLGKAYQRAAKAINARFRAEWKADNDE